MVCEFPVAVKAKLMLTAIHCLLYFFTLLTFMLMIACYVLCYVLKLITVCSLLLLFSFVFMFYVAMFLF